MSKKIVKKINDLNSLGAILGCENQNTCEYELFIKRYAKNTYNVCVSVVFENYSIDIFFEDEKKAISKFGQNMPRGSVNRFNVSISDALDMVKEYGVSPHKIIKRLAEFKSNYYKPEKPIIKIPKGITILDRMYILIAEAQYKYGDDAISDPKEWCKNSYRGIFYNDWSKAMKISDLYRGKYKTIDKNEGQRIYIEKAKKGEKYKSELHLCEAKNAEKLRDIEFAYGIISNDPIINYITSKL